MSRNWEMYNGLVVRRYTPDPSCGEAFPEPYKISSKENLLSLDFVRECLRYDTVTFKRFVYSRKYRILLAEAFNEHRFCCNVPLSPGLDYYGICWSLNMLTHSSMIDWFPDTPSECRWKPA